ncbi:RNase T and UCH 1 domain containing protein [Trichuris trichiura]|uniref:RNase T and UCH 1 domain containing protein n=1 Tax=Trichuris trichiura TaxID=36087 RepID=A0A077YUT4_TRITR|nr:RNase T and UCH 1 domain containing protein [Trichuris trichiura]
MHQVAKPAVLLKVGLHTAITNSIHCHGCSGIGSVKEIPSHYQKAIPGKFVECKQQTVRTSSLCGLEAPIPNSYVNSVLLVCILYHVEPLRRRVLSHLCKRVFCLTCELSFLFHMLQQSTSDFSCSKTSLLLPWKTLRSVVAAIKARVLTYTLSARFLILPPVLVFPIVVSGINLAFADEQLLEKISFEKLLEQSFHPEQVKHAWCERCSKFRISTHRRWIRSLPDVLSINCNIDNDKIRSFWRRQQQVMFSKRVSTGNDELFEKNMNASNVFGRLSWLPFNLQIFLDSDGKVAICDRVDAFRFDFNNFTWLLQPKVGSDTDTTSNVVFYELQAVISYIKSGTVGHWVACIKALSNDSIRRSRWYLINDTQVNEIIPLEAVNFDVDWKVPCILLYSRPGLNQLHPDMRKIISERPSNISTAFARPSCLPGRDDLVAIDAEFVTLNHISDYVTKFSGIKPGDLDPTFADRPLTAMKVAYLKLRYLIDMGVKFVGHGLSNDFKVINIYVREQIIDTVQLFRLPRRRLVSLRFLIWHFFGIRIQSGTHDSDEDARSALMLYEKYTDIMQSPDLQFSHILNELYEHGQQLHWNVPTENLKS